MAFAAMLVAALFLVGCSSDGDSGMAGPMGPAGEAPSDEEIAAVVEAAVDEAVAEQPDADTTELDAAIAALTEQIAELTAEPATIPEILDGKKSTLSAADLAAASTKIAGELNGLYDHDVDADGDPDPDKSLVNLPEIAGDPTASASNVVKDALTRNVSHASQVMEGADDYGDFLTHTFKTGTKVDLTSPGDVATLKLGNLLTVDGVTLMSVSMKETDKVAVDRNKEFDPAANTFVEDTETPADNTETLTTTLGADGSSSRVVTDNTGDTEFSETITYAGGSKIVEYNAAVTADLSAATDNIVVSVDVDGDPNNVAAMVTRADGDTLMVRRVDDADAAMDDGNDYGYDPANPDWMNRDSNSLPAADLAEALRAYATSTDKPAQHSLMGYGGWLTDSFFIAYRISAEDDAVISDPDEVAMKVAFGGREHDSDIASDLSGFGETATWKGLMVGHDMDGTAATANEMLKGNASVTARVSAATLADQAAGNVSADVVDVSLTNIITGTGTAVSRVADGIHWTNLDLDGGSFAKGTEVMGAFYDNGNEVVGQFSKEKILGVFGAVEYEMMEAMASE